MTTSFLEEYTKVVTSLLKGSVGLDKIQRVLFDIEITIDAYSDFVFELTKTRDRWEKKTRELCLLRDSLRSEFNKIKETDSGEESVRKSK